MSQRTFGMGLDVGDILRADDDLLILAGENGRVSRSSNTGATWDPLNTPASNDIYALKHFGSTVWASGRHGWIVCSNDLGCTWTAQSSGTAERLPGIQPL